MGKRYRADVAKVEVGKQYAATEAFRVVESLGNAKFDETVDVALRLGVDAKKSDQMVRGSVALPHGLGKTVRILVFAKGEQATVAEQAGADFVGVEEFLEKIEKGWLEFDKVVATPDQMGKVSKVARILGPRGLMPNPKLGTVTPNVAVAVKELKAGRVEFRIDKAAIIHAPLGRKSFGAQKLQENYLALLEAIWKAKPSTAKGQYIRSVAISTTMGPGIKLNPLEAANL